MKRPVAELLVADIGSTVTKLCAFAGLSEVDGNAARFLGQGFAATTVAEGDIVLGLDEAREDLERRLEIDTSDARWMAASSAAGGLRMSVHGLTTEMTLRAAREASLGAGANVVFTSAGALGQDDIDQLCAQQPKMILLAGGVDYGDREIVIGNARVLAATPVNAPVIYAGNRTAAREVERLFLAANKAIFVVDNVYPSIDELNIEPVRNVIQEVFSTHIVSAPGLDRVRRRVHGTILPTPGAVMLATEMLAERLGNVMTIDVGGATTDVHSVTRDTPEHEKLRLRPEPGSKRTVEGDLGVYFGAEQMLSNAACSGINPDALVALPRAREQREATIALTRLACQQAIRRHVGRVRPSYGVYGRTLVVEGRDLSAIQWIVGTGGALTRLGAGREILAGLRAQGEVGEINLMPPASAQILLDDDYLLAAAGVMSSYHRAAARRVLYTSLGLAETESAHG